MSKILITGGAGFIGAHYVNYMLENTSEDLVIVDKLTYAGDLNRIQHLIGDRTIFYQGDICDYDFIRGLFEKYTFKNIVNFAAESHVDRAIESSRSFFVTNVLGVQNLMDVSKNYWQNDEFFIQISTDEVYGGALSISDDKRTEAHPLAPTNPYAASKASGDLLIQSYGNTYQFPYKIVRMTNVYGHNQNKEKFIPTILRAILENQEIPLYGDGNYFRNWFYVSDACAAIDKVRNKGKLQNIYNLAGPGLVSHLELIQSIDQMMTQLDIPHHMKIKYVEDRLGHDLCYLIDDTKFQDLGHMNKTSLNSGLYKLIKNYR